MHECTNDIILVLNEYYCKNQRRRIEKTKGATYLKSLHSERLANDYCIRFLNRNVSMRNKSKWVAKIARVNVRLVLQSVCLRVRRLNFRIWNLKYNPCSFDTSSVLSSRKTKGFLSTCAATVCFIPIEINNRRQAIYQGGRMVPNTDVISNWLQHSRQDEGAFVAHVVHLHHKQQIIL